MMLWTCEVEWKAVRRERVVLEVAVGSQARRRSRPSMRMVVLVVDEFEAL